MGAVVKANRTTQDFYVLDSVEINERTTAITTRVTAQSSSELGSAEPELNGYHSLEMVLQRLNGV